jgi:hypothetical protein
MSTKRLLYTAGLKVEGSECHEHITIFATYNPDEINLKLQWENLPKKFVVNGECFVGPDNNIPVWCVRFLKDEKEGILFARSLFEEYNVGEEGNPMTNLFFPHITKKKETKLKIGEIVKVESFFIKKVGPHDPYFTVKF